MEDALLKIFNEFNGKEIKYSLIRNIDKGDIDVDLICFNEDLGIIECILEKYRAVKAGSSLYFPHLQYHIPILKNGAVEFLILDFIVDFKFGRDMVERTFEFNKELLFSEVEINNIGVKCASKEYMFVFLCIHVFFDRSNNINRYSELKLLFNSVDKEKVLVIFKELGVLINVEDFSSVDVLECHLSPSVNVKYISTRFGFISRKIISFVKRRFLMRKGLVVSVFGVDGAGKSTVIKNLENAFPRSVYLEYMGEKYTKNITFGIKSKLSQDTLFYSFLKIMHNTLYVLRRAVSSFKFYFYSLRKIVLLDRYLLDRFVPSPNTKLIAKKDIYFFKIIRRLVSLPDVTIFLSGDPDVISKRKNEFNLNSTSHAIKLQNEFILKSGIVVNRIDTTMQDQSAVTKEILILCAVRYQAKILGT
jgi:thymidylate kinase